MLDALERCIGQVREDEPRIVLVRSASERFFCVGANINVLKETDEETIVPWVMQGHRVLNLLEDLPMPVPSHPPRRCSIISPDCAVRESSRFRRKMKSPPQRPLLAPLMRVAWASRPLLVRAWR